MFQLNKQNYHTNEANQNYMSISQFKNFKECEAKEFAKLNGKWSEEQSTALIVGSYVHAAIESDEAFEKFIEENKTSIFKPKGSKYKDFIIADRMIETVKKDKLMQYVLTGEKEQIFTFELFDTKWKIMVDSLNKEKKFFTDLKTSQDIHKVYWNSDREDRVSFVEQYGYDLQMAVYEYGLNLILGETFTPFIAAVTKEEIPNKAVIRFEPFRLEYALSLVEQDINRILNVKQGIVPPNRCEKCDYCKSTKVLTTPIEVGDLIV